MLCKDEPRTWFINYLFFYLINLCLTMLGLYSSWIYLYLEVAFKNINIFYGYFISYWRFICIIDYWIQIAFVQFSKDLFGSFTCIVLRRRHGTKGNEVVEAIFYVTLMIDIIMRNISDEILGLNKFGHIQCSNKTFLAVV